MSAHERTGWRDERLSVRHRTWGFNCPAVDLDFLMVEYHLGKPVAIVEYKHHLASTPSLSHPTYRAITALADGYQPGPLPFILAFYWPDLWAFRVHPVNLPAQQYFGEGAILLTERQYVTRLHQIRVARIRTDILAHLNTALPASEFDDDGEPFSYGLRKL